MIRSKSVTSSVILFYFHLFFLMENQVNTRHSDKTMNKVHITRYSGLLPSIFNTGRTV